MTFYECFEYIVKNIHSIVFSMVNEKSYHVICAIDIMDFDEKGL